MTVSVPYSFCLAIFSHENIVLDALHTPAPGDTQALINLIQDIDAILRDDAPHIPPQLDADAAIWSLAVLHWGCKTLVNRFDTRTYLPKSLQTAEPSGLTPQQHWSVDIGLRFLTDLVRRTVAAAIEDPLIPTLLQIASRWPYSSIGTTADWPEERMQLLLTNPCMSHLICNRIQSRRDTLHAQHPSLIALYQAHTSMPQPIT